MLAQTRFTGDAGGRKSFAGEPLLRVEAPLLQAQLVETYLLNTLNYQTLLRHERLVSDVAGPTATLLEFGTRRAFSPQASCGRRGSSSSWLDATSMCWRLSDWVKTEWDDGSCFGYGSPPPRQ